MPLTGVSRTALGVAYMRANESQRPDRLFDDPYAPAFLAAAPPAFPTEEGARAGRLAAMGVVFGFHVVMRTRFFDDYLLAATRAGCRQVVLLAAGLDARAYRLTWPDGVRLFEVDLPEVLDFKNQVLADDAATPACERHAVAVDLRDDWAGALVHSGFEVDTPTAWLVEGLLIYLSATEASALLTGVTGLSVPGSQISFEKAAVPRPSTVDRYRDMPTMREFVALWKGGLGEDPGPWLTARGWQTHDHNGRTLATSYGRELPEDGETSYLTGIRQ
jgi:methyltransferase (TIGR00027 family)